MDDISCLTIDELVIFHIPIHKEFLINETISFMHGTI